MPAISSKAAPGALVALLALAAAGPARAESSPQAVLGQARTFLDHQEYTKVRRAAGPLAEATDTPLHVRIAAYELLGVSELLLRDQDAAQEAFEALLLLDPGHRLSDPSYPPRISEFFGMVRESLGPTAEISLEHDPLPPDGLVPGGRVTLSARGGDELERVDRVVVLQRGAADEDYREAAASCSESGTCSATVTVPGSGLLEYYFEARAPSGARIGGAGTATAPFEAAIALAAQGPGPDDPGAAVAARPFHRTWWFWTVVAVGAAAVAGGVTAGVLLAEPPMPEPGTLGYAQLP